MRKRNGLWLPSDWDSPLSPLPWARRHFFMPGCPCCGAPSCTVFSEDFETDLSNWDQVAESWSISSGAATAPDSALLIGNTTASDELILITALVEGDSGDRPRIIIDYQDTNNYHYAELEIGVSGYIKIFKRESGSDTELATRSLSTSANTDVEFMLCVNQQGYLSAGRITQGNVAHTSTFFGSGAFGIGTGATAVDVQFKNVTVEVVSEDCEKCGLNCGTQAELNCTEASNPAALQIEIQAGTFQAPPGGNYQDGRGYEGTYVALRRDNDSANCWFCVTSGSGSTAFNVFANMTHLGGGSPALRLAVRCGIGTPLYSSSCSSSAPARYAGWLEDFSAPLSCFGSWSVAWQSYNLFSPFGPYIGAGSAPDVLVTALY